MRALIVLLIVFASFVSMPAAEPPLVVIKLTSVHAALDDLEAFGVFDDPQAERERFLYELVEPLRLPLGDWLDFDRPAFITSSQAGVMGDHEAIVALLPVLEVDDALRALGGDPESEPQDGIHELSHEEDLRWYVVGEDDYLTIGMKREEVVGFDRDALEGLDLPPGSMGLEFNLEIVAPMLEGMISTQRETMNQQLAEMKKQQESVQGDDQDPEPQQVLANPEALASMTDFYFDLGLTILRNTARIQVSLDGVGDSAVLRTRVVPTEDSELEALLAEQPVGYGKLGRAVPEVPAFISFSGNYRLTDEVREGLVQFTGRYISTMEQMSAMIPEMSWITEMLGGQQEMIESRFACMAGEMAGILDIAGDAGMRSIQLSRIRTDGDCETLADREIEAMQQLLGPDGESVFTVTEPNVAPGDVRARRVEVDMERLVDGDETATAIVEAMLGSQGPVTYFGQADDVTVNVSGPDAEQTFTEVVDRLQTRRKRGGLTPEAFAPLEAGSGIFAVVDLSRFDLAEILGQPAPQTESEEDAETSAEEEDPLSGRMVIGAHAERGRLAIDVALAAGVVRSWFEDDGEEGVPSNLWPPPPAPVSVDEETSGAVPDGENPGDIRTAGEGAVTLPVIVHKIPPDYPEPLRLASLEGSVTLLAVVSREGDVQDVRLLSCDGKHPDEPQPRTNLLHESVFCTALADAAIAAVERWRYEPAREGEEPVDVYFTVRVDFELQ